MIAAMKMLVVVKRLVGRTHSLDAAAGGYRVNNFDFIRLVSAAFVIISHSFALLGYPEPMVARGVTLGGLGVFIFFSISGFLVARSWMSHPRSVPFLAKRVLRIFPGLFVVTLFGMFVIGPLFTGVGLRQYFADPWTVNYLGNLLLLQPVPLNLVGVVFHGAPTYAQIINGSLWTLKYEMAAYIGLVALAYANFFSERKLWRDLAILEVVLAVVFWLQRSHVVYFYDFSFWWLFRFGGLFLVGSLYYIYRHQIAVSDRLAAVALTALVATANVPGGYVIWLLALPYLIFYLAFMKVPLVANAGRFGDFSYGIYIYGWPVTQSIITLENGQIGPLRLGLSALAVSLVLAAGSWHLVEKRGLRLKRYFRTDRYPYKLPLETHAPVVIAAETPKARRPGETVLRRYRVEALSVAAIVMIGLFKTHLIYHGDFVIYPNGFPWGDPSTFLSFANNFLRGEHIYTDFIHFRTPGDFFVTTAIVKLFGDQVSSVNLFSALMGCVLYPVTFFVAARVIARNWLVAATGAALCLMLPDIFQTRTAFGLAAIALYIAARRRAYDWRIMVAVGIVIGICFDFGQDTGLFAGFCVALSEIVGGWQSPQRLIGRLGWLVGGAFIGVAPVLIYVVSTHGLTNFLYYTLPYALVIQPKYMNLPFPDLSFSTLTYYLPLFIYALAGGWLYLTDSLEVELSLLLGFAYTRFISALGRADIWHLLFSIPELFIVLPLVLATWRRPIIRARGMPAAVITVVLGAIGLVATRHGSSWLILAAVIVIVAGRLPSRQVIRAIRSLNWGVAIMAVVVVWSFWSLIATGAKDDWRAFRHHDPGVLESGVYATPAMAQELNTAASVAAQIKPQTVFSFPIEPFYYTLAPHHAARFMTFEPETQPKEEAETIQDLGHTKPQLVILDEEQAEALSARLGTISDYLYSHYQITARSFSYNYLMFMVPKTIPTYQQHLLDHMYERNLATTVSAYHFIKDGHVANYMIAMRPADFVVTPPVNAQLETALAYSPDQKRGADTCDSVELKSKTHTKLVRVCQTDGQISIPISDFAGQSTTIRFSASQRAWWLDPTITTVGNTLELTADVPTP